MEERVHRFRVDQIFTESPRAKRFRLRPEQGPLPFRFRAGQHVGVRPLAGTGEAGGREAASAAPGRWRHFSLCSSPLETGFLEVTVLRQGALSDRMHTLRAGAPVEVTSPQGRFVLQEPEPAGDGAGGRPPGRPSPMRAPVFYGAGIGMAPIRGMILYCRQRFPELPLALFAVFSSPEEALFKGDLEAWSAPGSGVSAWVIYTGRGREAIPAASRENAPTPDRADPAGRDGLQGEGAARGGAEIEQADGAGRSSDPGKGDGTGLGRDRPDRAETAGSGAEGGSGPWVPAFLAERLDRPEGRDHYLCAPPGLMDRIEAALRELGVPPDRIHDERW